MLFGSTLRNILKSFRLEQNTKDKPAAGYEVIIWPKIKKLNSKRRS